MFSITLINLVNTRNIKFPVLYWAPWILYIVIYLVNDFTYLGLQLTIQYTLPLLIGVVASGFKYTIVDFKWLFRGFIILCIFIYLLFLIGVIFRGGFGPSMAASVMFFSIAISFLSAFYFMTHENRYLLYIGILFLIPIIEITRMGIAATAAVFILHFANNKIRNKIFFGLLGGLALWFVFNTKGVQEKTFRKGTGELSELTFDYYANTNVNNNGRGLWKAVLQPGLKASPVWGNGPRADNEQLIKITKQKAGEAHNDYLAVRYNYGYVGLGLLLTGFLLTFISLYRISQRYKRNDLIWLLSTSSLTLFISFLMFMYTDNILKYTIYFPNYFFALIGITYSFKRDEDFRSSTSL